MNVEEVKEVVEETPEEKQDIPIQDLDADALDAALQDEGEPSDEEEEPEDERESEVPAEEEAEAQEEEAAAAEEDQHNEKLEKQVKDKEEFIQRQASEIGALRKQILDMQAAMPETPEESLYYSDPAEAVNQVLKQREQAAYIENLNHAVAVKENELTVKTIVPDIDDLIDSIADTALKDGATQETVRAFKNRPYNAPPDLVIQLAKRVKAEKEVETLKARIAELEKKPDDVLKKVEAAARTGKTLTAKTGQSGGGSVSEKSRHMLTDAELDDLLR